MPRTRTPATRPSSAPPAPPAVFVYDAATLRRLVEDAQREASAGLHAAIADLRAALGRSPEWVDTAGAARYLDVEPRTVEAWRSLADRPLPAHRIAGVRGYRYRPSELDAWLASRAEPAT